MLGVLNKHCLLTIFIFFFLIRYNFSFSVDSIWSKMLSLKIYFKTLSATENKIYDKKDYSEWKSVCCRLFKEKKKKEEILQNGQNKFLVGPNFVQQTDNFLRSAQQIDDFFLIVFPEKKHWHFMQIVSIRYSLPEMSNPVFWEKNKRYFKCCWWNFYPER